MAITKARSAPIGYASPTTGHQWVNFIGVDNHVHELYWNGIWHYKDLNVHSGQLDHLAFGNRAFGYVHPNGTSHVFYNSGGNVIEFFWDPFQVKWLWTHVNSGGPQGPAEHADITAYVANDGTQHVAWIKPPGEVIDMACHGVNWVSTNLTIELGFPSQKPNTQHTPWAYVHPKNNTLHINYLDTSGRLHEFWNDGSWHYNNLFAAAGVPNDKTSATEPKGYVTPDDFQHIVYRTSGMEIIELWWDGAWHFANLSTQVSHSHSDAAQGYVDSLKQQRIPVRHPTLFGRIQLLWFNGQWQLFDLGPTQAGNECDGMLRGYANPKNATEHITYRGLDGDIHELWATPTAWKHENLSQHASQ
ncbi:hypothetical protein [Rhodococcus tibetensis]|uniref:Fucose-specific lectin n=1 Tax=Rhodococcus tibetensis TaxID=2965064 RepID=A0ABT1Q7B2_9NOCA|nr:hypothetical protein [Rhodococcus sp. FXJ9.536]MCQ4118145.1 hypothetical protein [Rhodococcus sp. FXJ9.536]